MAKKRVGTKQYQKPTRIDPTVQVVVAAVLFVAATILANQPTIAGWESSLFFSIHNLPSFLFPIFYLITQAGSIYMLAILLGFYVYKRHTHIVLRLLMTGSLAYLVAGFAKSLWGRGRPYELLDSVALLDTIQGPGFPSGHTALATALALTIGHYLLKKYHWIPVVWILGVAASRVYLGAHLPLDIIGGFALGWLSYALFRHVRIYDIAPGKKRKTKTKLAIKK